MARLLRVRRHAEEVRAGAAPTAVITRQHQREAAAFLQFARLNEARLFGGGAEASNREARRVLVLMEQRRRRTKKDDDIGHARMQ